MSEFPPDLVEKKAKQRLALRKEYLKHMTNPYAGEGHIFDPAIQRYLSMRASGIEFFRETPRSTLRGILILAVPFALSFYFIKKNRDEQEALWRSGSVAYKDRLFKFQ